MVRNFVPLPVSRLHSGAGYHQPAQVFPERVTFEDPALHVMTDFKHVSAFVIDPNATMETANLRMIMRKIRLLMVVDDQNEVIGLITATDITGEKPVLFMQSTGAKRNEILVRDIMTPQEKLEVLAIEDVHQAKVGHVVATLKKAGRQHAMVVDHHEPGNRQMVRGVFSTSQIARLLGVQIETTEVARTFAEIENQLSH